MRVPETFESVTLDSDGDEEEVNVTDIARQWAPVDVYFLWVSIIINTQMLIASIVVAFWLAAKVFRVGILMTGKPPGFMAILKLLSPPVAAGARSGRQ